MREGEAEDKGEGDQVRGVEGEEGVRAIGDMSWMWGGFGVYA